MAVKGLQALGVAELATGLPIPSNLLRILCRGDFSAWTPAGYLAGVPEAAEVSALGWQWLGSGALQSLTRESPGKVDPAREIERSARTDAFYPGGDQRQWGMRLDEKPVRHPHLPLAAGQSQEALTSLMALVSRLRSRSAKRSSVAFSRGATTCCCSVVAIDFSRLAWNFRRRRRRRATSRATP